MQSFAMWLVMYLIVDGNLMLAFLDGSGDDVAPPASKEKLLVPRRELAHIDMMFFLFFLSLSEPYEHDTSMSV